MSAWLVDRVDLIDVYVFVCVCVSDSCVCLCLQILSNLVMEILLPEIRDLISPRLKGKMHERQRNWMLVRTARAIITCFIVTHLGPGPILPLPLDLSPNPRFCKVSQRGRVSQCLREQGGVLFFP